MVVVAGSLSLFIVSGVNRFVCVGMCYGAWVAAKLSAQDAAVVGIFGPHPSIGVEARMGGDAVALCKAMQCEVFPEFLNAPFGLTF